MKKKTKYIFIVGGVMSGVGKGVAAASLGKILQSRGFKVTAIKADPYINYDAGTMNPTEHGEVFVTEDGDETDQDVGNYERFLDQNIYSANYMTTGRVYLSVIEKERNLEYEGKCVEVVPHIPSEIIRRIENAGKKTKSEIVIIEIGGTIGEYQNILFLEAGRMMKLKKPDDVMFILVSYLPIPSKVGEMKTKPTQNAARSLNSVGIQADFIFCRSEKPLDKPRKQKIATFCNIKDDSAISAPDIESIYEIPINFEKENLSAKVISKLGLNERKSDLKEWSKLVRTIKSVKKPVKIAIVGKYFNTGEFTLVDSYISVVEALKHASWFSKRKPELYWLNSEDFEKDPKKLSELKNYDGVLIPGGFGSRGIEGKLKVIKFVRENNIPYFGLCYGMQLVCIEFARDVLKLRTANSVEIDPDTKHPVIDVNPYQQENIQNKRYGGTMRLGAYPAYISKGTKAYSAYKTTRISERHRHRYEFNNKYLKRMEKKGMVFSAFSPGKKLVEIVEIKNHPWFVGVQFHPEFKSRPITSHPLFREFIKACIKNQS